MDFTKEEYQRRLKKVQKMMQEKGIELLISHDTNNLNYLTGYDAWSFYYAQCAIVHVNAEEPLCFVRAQDAGGAYIRTYLKMKILLFMMKIIFILGLNTLMII
jgi:Xaa-Pro dipeptidase/ectoine hydrolase